MTGIEQDGDHVTVTTADGANFTAKYAILTASLGVLKQADIDFEPPLPEAKLIAIEEMVGACRRVPTAGCLPPGAPGARACRRSGA